MNSGAVLKTMPIFWGEVERCAQCVNCGSKTQALFRFESESGHIGARCCRRCGEVKRRLYPLEFIKLVSGAMGDYLPTEVSPHE